MMRAWPGRRSPVRKASKAIFNQHPWIYRSALVGAGSKGSQTAVIFLEAWPEHRAEARNNTNRFYAELRQLAVAHQHTARIEHFLLVVDSLPVDIRHNAKIFREKLVPAAEEVVRKPRR